MPVWMSEDDKPRFSGRVLAEGEMNFPDDSDFYAVVWMDAHEHEWALLGEDTYGGRNYRCSRCDLSHRTWRKADGSTEFESPKATEARIFRVEYATTRGPCTGHCSVDATPEVRERADGYLVAEASRVLRAGAERQARSPAVGRRARVLRGKNHGAEGAIVWLGQQATYMTRNWDRPVYEWRVGVRVADGSGVRTVFTGAGNVEVLDPPAVDEAAVARTAERFRGQYRAWTSERGMAFVGDGQALVVVAGA